MFVYPKNGIGPGFRIGSRQLIEVVQKKTIAIQKDFHGLRPYRV